MKKRYISFYMALALYDLEMYKTTKDEFYLQKAIEALNNINKGGN